MAFLRSVARCNSLVLKKLPGAGGSKCASSALDLGGNAKFFRSELLASHRYYVELRRELNSRCNGSGVVSSTAAAGSDDSTRRRAASTSAGMQTNSDGTVSPKDALDVSFNNPSAAFKSKTTWELVRAYLVYLMCSSGYIVEHNLQVSDCLLFFFEFRLALKTKEPSFCYIKINNRRNVI